MSEQFVDAWALAVHPVPKERNLGHLKSELGDLLIRSGPLPSESIDLDFEMEEVKPSRLYSKMAIFKKFFFK